MPEEMQQMDQSKLVPLITAALKESNEIETLKFGLLPLHHK